MSWTKCRTCGRPVPADLAELKQRCISAREPKCSGVIPSDTAEK